MIERFVHLPWTLTRVRIAGSALIAIAAPLFLCVFVPIVKSLFVIQRGTFAITVAACIIVIAALQLLALGLSFFKRPSQGYRFITVGSSGGVWYITAANPSAYLLAFSGSNVAPKRRGVMVMQEIARAIQWCAAQNYRVVLNTQLVDSPERVALLQQYGFVEKRYPCQWITSSVPWIFMLLVVAFMGAITNAITIAPYRTWVR